MFTTGSFQKAVKKVPPPPDARRYLEGQVRPLGDSIIYFPADAFEHDVFAWGLLVDLAVDIAWDLLLRGCVEHPGLVFEVQGDKYVIRLGRHTWESVLEQAQIKECEG